jgi:glycosyltransferase involved in cell wall biosynthesis
MGLNVSIILACYNGARWIGKAIESILTQTYKDFEILIIDDGSTDNSKKIVNSYFDQRVRYFYQRNRGFSAAVNRGIKESRGNLIGFIGQDDLWMPNKLELQIKYFSEHKYVDLVYSDFYSFNSKDRIIRIIKGASNDFSSKQEIVMQLFLGNFIGFETVLLKKKCFDEIGLLDERMVAFSDHDIWLRIAGSFKIGYLALPLVKKREHKSQLSNAKEIVMRDEFLIVKKAIDRYPFLKRVELRKLFLLYYAWGTYLLTTGKDKEARQKLIKAIRCQPWQLKAVGALLVPVLYSFVLDRYTNASPKIHTGLRWLEQ